MSLCWWKKLSGASELHRREIWRVGCGRGEGVVGADLAFSFGANSGGWLQKQEQEDVVSSPAVRAPPLI